MSERSEKWGDDLLNWGPTFEEAAYVLRERVAELDALRRSILLLIDGKDLAVDSPAQGWNDAAVLRAIKLLCRDGA